MSPLEKQAADRVKIREVARQKLADLEAKRAEVNAEADRLAQHAEDLRASFGDLAARVATGDAPRNADAKARAAYREAVLDHDAQVAALDGLDRMIQQAESELEQAKRSAANALVAVAAERARDMDREIDDAIQSLAQRVAERQRLARFASMTSHAAHGQPLSPIADRKVHDPLDAALRVAFDNAPTTTESTLIQGTS